MISTSLGGNTIMRTGGMRPSSTKQWATNQSQCSTAAGEGPLSRHTKPAIDGCGHARRVESAAEDHVGSVGVHRVERRAWEQAEDHRRRASDHRRPPDRTIGLRQLGDDVHLLGQVERRAAMAARHQHPEAPGVGQRSHQIGRQPPALFDLVGTGRDVWRQFPNCVHDLVGRSRSLGDHDRIVRVVDTSAHRPKYPTRHANEWAIVRRRYTTPCS